MTMPALRSFGKCVAGPASRGLCAALALLAAAFLVASPAASATRRVALVVGEADYQSLPKLDNTLNDSRAVNDALTKAGFEVYYGANQTRLQFEDLIKRFYRAADGAEIALVYYSGHGVQIAGANYIVPVDAKLATAYDIEQQTLNVDDIFQYLSAHTSAQLIFLDACRNNPFHAEKFWVVDKLQPVEADQGLAKSTYSMGSLIAYSTTPGKVAYDGGGDLSPYTSAFIRHVPVPNQEIREALTQVRRDVIEATGGKQVPWENSSLIDDIYLVRAPAAPSVAPMLRVDVPAGAQTPLNLPKPLAQTNSELVVNIDRLPEQGRILLDGKPLESARAITVADLDRLSFDPNGAPTGAVGLMSYSVSDPWKQSARGFVAIAVGGPNSAASPVKLAAAQDAREDAAKAFLKTLDGVHVAPEIGVGPVRLNLAAPLDPKFDASAQAEVTNAPAAGALRLGDRVLTQGARFSLLDIKDLGFEPKIGSEGRPETAVLSLVDSPGETATIAIDPALNTCDVEAASPLDLQGVTTGKLPNELNAAAVLSACQSAVSRYPNVPRFVFQLGRGQLASGQLTEAQKSFAAAAAKKHQRALAALGQLEQSGALGPSNPAKADGYYATCAAAGDAYCLHTYGDALFYGKGIAKKPTEGMAMMIRAAELGHTFAMNELGGIFIAGRDAPKDVERGIRYWEAGAARADIYSFNDLGQVYLEGQGRPVDLGLAVDYFTKAADGGQPYAPAQLGRMYRDGKGVPADRAAAAKWLEMGASRGDYWAALDRARLNDGSTQPNEIADTARFLAFAAAINVNHGMGNTDPQNLAAHQLAAVPADAKKAALVQLEGELGAQKPALKAKGLDDQLVEVSKEIWTRGKPRYDLF